MRCVQEVLRLLFRLRTDSTGLMQDKKKIKIILDERCRKRCGAFIGVGILEGSVGTGG